MKTENTTLDFQTAVTSVMADSGLSHAQIAERLGYPKPSVIALIAAGMAKFPPGRAADLARACGADPEALTALALAECEDEADRALPLRLDGSDK